MGALVCMGAQESAKPHVPSPKSHFIMQFSPKSTITQPAVRDCNFVYQVHPARSNDLTPVTIISLEIWNFFMAVSAIHNDEMT